MPSFADRVRRLEEFISDEHWRAQVFGRAIVEREVGHEIAKRTSHYEVKFGEWSTEIVTELPRSALSRKIHGVPIPANAEVVITSD